MSSLSNKCLHFLEMSQLSQEHSKYGYNKQRPYILKKSWFHLKCLHLKKRKVLLKCSNFSKIPLNENVHCFQTKALMFKVKTLIGRHNYEQKTTQGGTTCPHAPQISLLFKNIQTLKMSPFSKTVLTLSVRTQLHSKHKNTIVTVEFHSKCTH